APGASPSHGAAKEKASTYPSAAHRELQAGRPAAGRGRRMLLGSARRRTIARQIGSALLTLFLISIVTFGMMSVRTPDQIAREKFGNQVTTEQVTAFSHQFGLDKPVYERYGKWLWRFAHGDMGTSYVTGVPVATNVLPRFQRTLILSVVSLLIAFPIS